MESRTLLAATLAISEINYDPYAPAPDFGDISEENDDYEFIELVNNGQAPINLNGVKFVRITADAESQGVDFVFGNETLAPDERIVIVENAVAFRSRYGDGPRVAGEWAGGLSNGGELLTLRDVDEAEIERFSYDSGGKWPRRAAGQGATLERKVFEIDPTNRDTDPNDPDAWRSSIEYGGTPGAAPGDRLNTVIFNEVLAHTDPPQIDIIELLNTTDQEVDLSGWYLSDDINAPFKFAIENGSSIPPNGYFLVDETDFNPGGGTEPSDFALSERGDELWLISAGPDGRPDRFVDRVRFGPSVNGVSLGNVNNIDERSELQPLAELTLGKPNGAQRVGEVIISEVQYHPPDDDVFKEFIELENTTVFSIPLDNWEITDAVDVRIPVGTAINPGESIVLTAFDPADAEKSSLFRSYYGIDETVRLVGPWGVDVDGQPDTISNTGEKITLKTPHDDVTEILLVPTDQVDFNDKLPWPVVADGFGGAIHRVSSESYGNAPESWIGALPSPGNQPMSFGDSPSISVDEAVTEVLGTDGTFERGGTDVDVYTFEPAASGNFEISATAVGELGTNTYLRVFSADGVELASNDDHGESTDSQVTLDLEGGSNYFIVVTGSSPSAHLFDPFTGRGAVDGSRGTYSLTISAGPDVISPTPWRNPRIAEDVNNDGFVVPLDALLVINELNSNGAGLLPTPSAEAPPPFFDVNGDGHLAPIDALLVINRLNSDNAVLGAAAVSPVNGAAYSRIVGAALDAQFMEDDEVKDKTLAGRLDSKL